MEGEAQAGGNLQKCKVQSYDYKLDSCHLQQLKSL